MKATTIAAHKTNNTPAHAKYTSISICSSLALRSCAAVAFKALRTRIPERTHPTAAEPICQREHERALRLWIDPADSRPSRAQVPTHKAEKNDAARPHCEEDRQLSRKPWILGTARLNRSTGSTSRLRLCPRRGASGPPVAGVATAMAAQRPSVSRGPRGCCNNFRYSREFARPRPLTVTRPGLRL